MMVGQSLTLQIFSSGTHPDCKSFVLFACVAEKLTPCFIKTLGGFAIGNIAAALSGKSRVGRLKHLPL
jgi:hypothetical protein